MRMKQICNNANAIRIWNSLSHTAWPGGELGEIVVRRRRVPRANVSQDHMERFWSNSIFKYLRVEPEDHYFLLTEPVRLIFSNV
jgi:hypothetical protein